MRRLSNWLTALLLLANVLLPARLAFADGDAPHNGDTGETSSVWSEVFQPDGSLQPGLQDVGTVTQQVDWIPNIPGLNGVAKYHVYVTPSGDTVVMPTATTLFFMAANADKSGFDEASAYVMNGVGSQIRTAGMVTSNPKQAFAQMAKALGLWDDVKDKYTSPDEFADAVISGKETWSWGLLGDIKNILSTLLKNSKNDKALYTAFLVYTPDSCQFAPGGCPPEALAAIATPPPPPPSECAPAKVHLGRISGTARVVAPNYPLVVGQDPDKRGADLEFTLTIEPTIYTWFEAVHRSACRYVPGGTGQGCPYNLSHDANTVNNPYYQVYTWTDCVRHTVTLPETANWVKATATLSQDSREWITRGSLGIRYPGAYLHHPDWWWFNPPQAEKGISGYTYHWRFLVKRVQVADPGTYNLILDGYTSGTAVSSGRPFHMQVGTFQVAVFTSTLHR